MMKDYLEDGVNFWKINGFHHPFISRNYHKDGVRYHRNFAKLNLDKTYAKNISFMELFDIPTVGRTGSKKSEFYSLLNYDYLQKVENIIRNSKNKKVVFISGSVLKALTYIKKRFNLFTWLPTERIKGVNKAHKIFDKDGVRVYQVFHFSAAIKDDHIKEIRVIIDEFNDNTTHYGNSLQLALAVGIKIIEDLSNVTDVRMYTWHKEPGNYYITLYPAEFMQKSENVKLLVPHLMIWLKML